MSQHFDPEDLALTRQRKHAPGGRPPGMGQQEAGEASKRFWLRGALEEADRGAEVMAPGSTA